MRKKLLLSLTAAICCLSAWAQDDPLDQLTIEDGVVQIATVEDMENFALAVNAGNLELSAVLTADIATYTGPAIASSGAKYAGTFDGQYHTLTVDLKSNEASYGLFRYVQGGTIKNLHVAGKYEAANNKVGVIVGELYGATVENCWVSADIAATFTGDGAIAGIAGRSSADGNVIRDCIFTGNVTGETAYNCAGIVGWCGNKIAIENCIVTGVFATDQSQGNARSIARHADDNTNGDCVNCYYVNPNGTLTNVNTTQVTEEFLATGELGFMLNIGKKEMVWYQNLEGDDVDKFPVPIATHKVIYPAGNLNCIGLSIDGSPVTYSNTKTTELPPHDYVDGICTMCGQADPGMAELVDGYYELGIPEQVIWFATRVNSGETGINAKLVNDIDMTAFAESFIAIGTNSNRYAGIFDGQFHTLTVDFAATEASYGFFRYLQNATVKNLHVDGKFEAAYNKTGVIVGEMFASTVENCWVSADIAATFTGDGAIAGIAGRSSADGNVIRNCLFTGNVTGATAYNCTGMVGWCANKIAIENCLVTGIFDTDQSQGNARPIARHDDGNTNAACVNCYFVNPNGNRDNVNTKQVTAEQVASGEICYLLNGDQSVITWFQTLEEELVPTPIPGSATVYNIYDIYGNAYDNASFRAYAADIIYAEEEYCENVIAQIDLVDAYREVLETLNNYDNIDDLMAACELNNELRNSLHENAAAYAAYQEKIEEVGAYLEEHPELQNAKRDELEDYLEGDDGPSELYSNGQAQYILDERALSTEEIKAETKKVDQMLEIVIIFSPVPGTYVTRLLTNPDFVDGFNGWEGKVGTGYGSSATSNIRAAECYDNTMDMYQTLTGLENGVYELQVNGAFRPYPSEDFYSTNYAATLYANGVHNYFQANIEDMIPESDAQDGFNCHITGDVPDYQVTDTEGNLQGYTMHGIISCCNAFQGGRYNNSILVNVTDGTLTVGIRQPGTGNQPEWLGFGNIQLIYHGTIDEAGDALDRVLESQSARATTMLTTYQFSTSDDYKAYPNFSQALKDGLAAAVEAVATTTDLNEKYALVEKFSDLFLQVLDCKKAYVSLFEQMEQANALLYASIDMLTDEQVEALYALVDKIESMYAEGTASTEEAQKDYLSELDFTIKQVDGIYQIGTPFDFIQFASIVNGGTPTASAVLTADVDMSEVECGMIGSNGTPYAGVFDGQYHTLNINNTASGESYGLFGGLSGTIKNLHLTGTVNTGYKKTGGIVGEIFGGTILNCWISVDILSTLSDDSAYGGIVSRASSGVCTISNCVFDGKIEGENAYNCAGILGWTGDNTTPILTNCLFSGSINCKPESSENYSYTIARRPSNVTIINCYFVNEWVNHNDGTTQVTEEQLASGEVTFLLNGDQKDIQWTQTIGEDTTPVPYPTGSVVYIHGNLNCDGISLIDGEATYENEPCTTIASHQFVDGICIVCGTPNPDMADLVDGYYQLGTPEQLQWFIAKVNSGENTLNAKLVDDIDMSGFADSFVPFASTSNHYAGEFDGQYHTLTVSFAATEASYGLFRYLDGTVKNLHVAGIIDAAYNKVGVIAGEMFGATVENCWVSADIAATFNGDGAIAGIAGRSSANGNVIRNCLFSGNVTGVAYNCAGIVGWCGNKIAIENCLVTGVFDTDQTQGNARPIARHADDNTNGDCVNCYFVNPNGERENVNTTQITEEQLASGEICYLLNGDQTNIQWTQTLGEDALPIPFPNGSVVDQTDEGYINPTAINTIAEDKTQGTTIYNLMGQKVKKAEKGIYIINGKKVLVK